MSIAFLAISRLCEVLMFVGVAFQSLAVSTWKLNSDFLNLQESLKILLDWPHYYATCGRELAFIDCGAQKCILLLWS